MKKRSNWRGSSHFAHDVCAAALAWAALYWLRFNLDFKESYLAGHGVDARVDPAAAGGDIPGARPAIAACGVSRASSTCSASCSPPSWARFSIPVVLVMLKLQAVVPRSVLVFYPVVLIFLMTGSRFAYRIWKEHRLYSPLGSAGRAGAHHRRRRSGRSPGEGPDARAGNGASWGLLDDDRAKQGPPAAQRQRVGSDLGAQGLGASLRGAQSHHRVAFDEPRAFAGASPSCAPRRAWRR